MNWIIVGVVAFIAFLLIRSFLRKGKLYKAIFSLEHYEEIVDILIRLKREAVRLQPIDDDAQSLPVGDPRTALSKAGLLLLYTIDYLEDENAYLHSISLSIAGGYTPHAVGERFILFILHNLNFPKADVLFEVSENNVFYLRAITDEETFEEYKKQNMRIPSRSEIENLLEEIQAQMKEIPFQRMDTGLRHQL